MTRIAIPRSDNLSAKKVEASDFEKYFPSCVIRDYVRCGLTASAGSGLAVNIAAGDARVKGIYLGNTAPCSVTGLTACSTNYIYATLCRDPSCEPQAWSFTKNTNGVVPADSVLVARAITDSTSVTSTDQTGVVTTPTNLLCVTNPICQSKLSIEQYRYGSGLDGCATISTNTNLSGPKEYQNLTVNSGQTLSASSSLSSLVIRVRCTLTVNGTIEMDGEHGSSGGSGGTGGSGGSCGANGNPGNISTSANVSFPINITSRGGSGGHGGSGGNASGPNDGNGGGGGSAYNTA